MLNSSVCRYEHFHTDWYHRWCSIIGFDPKVYEDQNHSYRKSWEWAAIFQTAYEHDMLRPGRSAIGFAVGQEWLVSVFANMGVQVLATDMPAEHEQAEHWAQSNQHAASLDAMFHPNCIERDKFDERVSFQPIDMTDISSLPSESADFIWSSCAIEHLGTLNAGLEFAQNAMRLVKPGGIAVHTTEYNCSSNDDTIEEGWNVIYRRKDIEKFERDLRRIRCAMVTPDFNAGHHPYDIDFDQEPYFTSKSRHIKLAIGNHVATSFVMIIKKA
jgi:2-polyprenyl-3-methyl-5-hydroxy-6-metoxy-1,4-benzoquinol methylase